MLNSLKSAAIPGRALASSGYRCPTHLSVAFCGRGEPTTNTLRHFLWSEWPSSPKTFSAEDFKSQSGHSSQHRMTVSSALGKYRSLATRPKYNMCRSPVEWFRCFVGLCCSERQSKSILYQQYGNLFGLCVYIYCEIKIIIIRGVYQNQRGAVTYFERKAQLNGNIYIVRELFIGAIFKSGTASWLCPRMVIASQRSLNMLVLSSSSLAPVRLLTVNIIKFKWFLA